MRAQQLINVLNDLLEFSNDPNIEVKLAIESYDIDGVYQSEEVDIDFQGLTSHFIKGEKQGDTYITLSGYSEEELKC